MCAVYVQDSRELVRPTTKHIFFGHPLLLFLTGANYVLYNHGGGEGNLFFPVICLGCLQFFLGPLDALAVVFYTKVRMYVCLLCYHCLHHCFIICGTGAFSKNQSPRHLRMYVHVHPLSSLTFLFYAFFF